MKGEAGVASSSEPIREGLVQSAVSFLKHPKVVASSDVQRRSFLENKGLTVDEINEAFGRLLSTPSNYMSSEVCMSQGVSDHSCGVTQQEAAIGTACVGGSGFSWQPFFGDDNMSSLFLSDIPTIIGTPGPETETVTPEPEIEAVTPRHPKSYMEIMELIQRGERPDDIQDINDEPPNPDQPISEPQMAPKPKPWEKQGQESSSLGLKPLSGDSSELRSEVQINSNNQAMGSNSNGSDQGDLLLVMETAMGSEAPTDDASSPKQ